MAEYSQVRAPRLCLMMREDIGYGFNLHGEKGVVGQYISAVDPGCAADRAGLCVGDRVIEVNGVNVESAKHNEVVERIRSDTKKTTLLVIDQVTDKYLMNLKIPITADLAKFTSVTEIYGPGCDDKSAHNNSPAHEKLEKLQLEEDNQVQKNDNVTSPEESSPKSLERNTGGSGRSNGKNRHSVPLDRAPTPPIEKENDDNTLPSTKDLTTPASEMRRHSEKPTHTDYYTDVSVNEGDRRASAPRTDITPESNGTYEKIRPLPTTVPRRKEVKQGDWRAKLALFDQL